MKKQLRSILSFAMLLFAVSATSVLAQEFRGTITGTVTDPNGAVVPGATVVVKSSETNVANTVTTNSEGSYTSTSPFARYIYKSPRPARALKPPRERRSRFRSENA